MATKSGELRETLLGLIEDVRAGKLTSEDANAISKVAAQINNSLKIEIDARLADENLAKAALGSMAIGEEIQTQE